MLHPKCSVLRILRKKEPDFRNEVWLFRPNLGRIKSTQNRVDFFIAFFKSMLKTCFLTDQMV